MDPPNKLNSISPITSPRGETASSLLARFVQGDKPIVHKMESPRALLKPSALGTSNNNMIVDLTNDDDEIQFVESRSTSWRNEKLQSSYNHFSSQTSQAPANSSVSADVDQLAKTPAASDRQAMRQEIKATTTARRNRFFVEKKDYFLPLLPPNNYVQKLVQQDGKLTAAEKSKLPVPILYQNLDVQPIGIEAIMKPYQLSGLSFLMYLHRNGLSGILGDEMGLGKTLQNLSLIQYLVENEPFKQRPFLVICPLSVLKSWTEQAQKWAPKLKVLRFKDSDSEDGSQHLSGVDLVVTTYETYQSEHKWFKRAFVWRYVILDEGHRIKNEQSQLAKTLQGINAEYRLLLTGTPLQNNLGELWALLHWLYPEVFVPNTSELFTKSFDLSKGKCEKTVLRSSRNLLELIMLRRMKTSPGVDLNLPPKTEVRLFVPLSPLQRIWYLRLITHADHNLLEQLFRGAKEKEEASLKTVGEGIEALEISDAGITVTGNDTNLGQTNDQSDSTMHDAPEVLEPLTEANSGTDEWAESKMILEQTLEREKLTEESQRGLGTTAWQKLMNLLLQLQKVSNHPYQIPTAQPDPYNLGEHIIVASGKFIVLAKLIKQLVVVDQKKVLIFSSFTHMLDLVEDLLRLRSGDGSVFDYARLDGSMVVARRNLSVRLFNDVKSSCRVMLISTKAGGLGITLTAASDVVMLDQEWNPQLTLQAEARAHRIGQTKPVTVYKLISQGTVEEQMMGRIQKKLYLSEKVTESMQDINSQAAKTDSNDGSGPQGSPEGDGMPFLDTRELLTFVRRGAAAISRPEITASQMLSWDWETILSKCKDQPVDVTVNQDTGSDAEIDEEAERKWLSEIERVESTVFEGRKLERGKRKQSENLEDTSNQDLKREDRRIGKETTVMIDGFAVTKESLSCKDWEAVPTLAGKDPRLAEPKREKKALFTSQCYCQVCLNGGGIVCCRECPRAYHLACLEPRSQPYGRPQFFICPQHRCAICEHKTNEAGGMLYRCRWCDKAYCEDCLQWEKTVLLGSNLQELEQLGYSNVTSAYFVQCQTCTDHFAAHPEALTKYHAMAAQSNKEYAKDLKTSVVDNQGQQQSDSNVTSRAPSLSSGMTIDTPSLATTPQEIEQQVTETSTMKKRKSEGDVEVTPSFKRTKQI